MAILITIAGIEDAQRKWGDGIVRIAAAHRTGGNYTEIATEHVEHLYAYNQSCLLYTSDAADEV